MYDYDYLDFAVRRFLMKLFTTVNTGLL